MKRERVFEGSVAVSGLEKRAMNRVSKGSVAMARLAEQ